MYQRSRISWTLPQSKLHFKTRSVLSTIHEYLRLLRLQGIYRVSAVKSKVHQLCEAFEKHGNSVSLTDINPNIIANVLKLYLRELPQPLFTFELYPEFIR